MSAKIININSEQEGEKGGDKEKRPGNREKKRGVEESTMPHGQHPECEGANGGVSKHGIEGCTYERPVGFGGEIFFLFEYLVGHEETDLDRSRKRSRSIIGVGGRK